MTKTLIVAIGSTVMKDDGVGPVVLDELRQREIAADLADLGTDIFRLRQFFKEHDQIIIIDAIQNSELTPGTVVTFTYDEFAEKLEGKIKNAHMLGVIDSLETMRIVDERLAQAQIVLVGIVAEIIDKGMALTASVKAAIPKAADKIISLLGL